MLEYRYFYSGLQEIYVRLFLKLFCQVIMHEDTDVLLSDYALLKVDEEEYSKLV